MFNIYSLYIRYLKGVDEPFLQDSARNIDYYKLLVVWKSGGVLILNPCYFNYKQICLTMEQKG